MIQTTERLYRMGIALEMFRRDFGVEAGPEDYPQWEQYLIAADEISEEEE